MQSPEQDCGTLPFPLTVPHRHFVTPCLSFTCLHANDFKGKEKDRQAHVV